MFVVNEAMIRLAGPPKTAYSEEFRQIVAHWRRKWQTTPVLLSGKLGEQRNLVGYGPWDHRESDIAEQQSTHNTPPNL